MIRWTWSSRPGGRGSAAGILRRRPYAPCSKGEREEREDIKRDTEREKESECGREAETERER